MTPGRPLARRPASLIVALLAALLLAACAGEADAPPPAASATTAASAAIAATATPTANAEVRPNDDIVASTASIALVDLDVVEFTNSAGEVATLRIEVPPRREYSIGLSGRYALGDRGMLFHYSEERQGAFWMKNTHINLAIAFIDAQFRIVEIREMVADSLDLITPASPYRYAVEAASGWYAQRGIEAGDRARFRFELPEQ